MPKEITTTVLKVGEVFTLVCGFKDCKHYKECKKERFDNLLESSIVVAGPDLHLVRSEKESDVFHLGCSKYIAKADVKKGFVQCRLCGWQGNKKELDKVEHRSFAEDQWDPIISYRTVCPHCHQSGVPCGDLGD